VNYSAAAFARFIRWLQLRLDLDSTAIRPRYDRSTNNVTTVWRYRNSITIIVDYYYYY